VLWKRIDSSANGLETSGDEQAVEQLLELDYVINPKTTPFH
jgi:hypothetical protein